MDIQRIDRLEHQLTNSYKRLGTQRDDLTLRLIALLMLVFASFEALSLASWILRLGFLGLFLTLVHWNQQRSTKPLPNPDLTTTVANVPVPYEPASTSSPVELKAQPAPLQAETPEPVHAENHHTRHRPSRFGLHKKRSSSADRRTPRPSITEGPVPTPTTAPLPSTEATPPATEHTYVPSDTWGVLGHLTPEQTAALDDMRRRFAGATCKDPGFTFDDKTFLRFLRARKFDVDKAQKMLAHHIEWNNKYLPSLVTPKDVKEILPCGLARLGPMTKDGLPIIMIKVEFYEPSSFHDLDLFVKYCAYNFYVVVRKLPPGAEKGVLFFDMRGWSLWRHANAHSLKLVGILIKIIQDQNPERLQKAVLFNAPAIFSGTWKLIKGLLDPVVAAKVVFVNDPAPVLEMVHRKDLPKEYGGDRVEPYPIEGLDQI